MLKSLLKRVLVLLLFSFSMGVAHGQMHPVLILESNLSYENGILPGVGLGIRKGQMALLPSFLFGEGRGGKFEFRWYQKLTERDRFRPYVSVQQLLYRQLNTCVDNSCPYLFYQFLPGVGTTVKVWKGFHINTNMACGVKKREGRELSMDFNLGIGVGYEF